MAENDDGWPGLHFREFAPDGTPPVLELLVKLDAQGRICDFSFGVADAADPGVAGVAALNVGIASMQHHFARARETQGKSPRAGKWRRR